MKQKIIQALSKYYKLNSIKRILQGARKPRYEVMIELHNQNIAPFTAWLNIKEYLNSSDNNISKKEAIKSPQTAQTGATDAHKRINGDK